MDALGTPHGRPMPVRYRYTYATKYGHRGTCCYSSSPIALLLAPLCAKVSDFKYYAANDSC